MVGIAYIGQRDLEMNRLDLFADFDCLLCSANMSADQIGIVIDHFGNTKRVGAYYLASQLSPEDAASYPGAMARHVPSMNPFIYGPPSAGLWNCGYQTADTIAWHVDRIQKRRGRARFVMLDNLSPTRFQWQPGVDFTGDGKADTQGAVGAAHRWGVIQFLDALKALGNIQRVPNTGHSCNPDEFPNPVIKAHVSRFCGLVHGIGIETGYTSDSYKGPFALGPRLSFAFPQDQVAWDAVQDMSFPASVVPVCPAYIVKA